MRSVMEGNGLGLALVGILPVTALALKVEDFGAALGVVLWILIGLVAIKILAIFAGVS